ncbi:MAG: hypothetical protein KGO99_05505 [Actinomycetales bacterium]|nr:hypothetical protein [Actinomycetales bacterium]
MNHLIRINVVGGSATTAFALPDEKWAWPTLLGELIPKSEVQHSSQKGLTLVRSLELISNLPECEVLVLHFGTSVGWPLALVKVGYRYGLQVHNEFGFHQPPKPYSGTPSVKMKKKIRLRFRNMIKYLLFFAGAYRPKVSIREIEDQVRAVIAIASKRTSRIIWVQHRSLQSMRIIVERKMYQRYYKRFIAAINSNAPANLTLVELDSDFLISENYLMDGVHLSEQGHYVLAHRLAELIKAQE